ncbi:MAG: DUF4965 domain-containing protein [Phycisphaeraceae bacterium]|nr:DUF4965 domain-containing protein [Phycisphaeraceae bacterium]
MQSMTWPMARLGSRFGLVFEPYANQVRHSALGRYLDEPVDLMVGLEEPDGRRRAMPFTKQAELFHNCEQFERANSITFRGHSERYRIRCEFNVHSVFYPQEEEMCMLPAFYLEIRVNPAKNVRWLKPEGPTPDKVKLFVRLSRPNTTIRATAGTEQSPARIDLAYRNRLEPWHDTAVTTLATNPVVNKTVEVQERIVSLNPEAQPDADGLGLTLELPVTDVGSGVKWRLVWAAWCGEPIVEVKRQEKVLPGRFRYTRYWNSLDDVVHFAMNRRDDLLVRSRNFEKTLEQASLLGGQRHLLNQSFQQYLANTWWCDVADGSQTFTVWEGSCHFHSTIDVEYNVCLLYLTLWPKLLAMQFDQWPQCGEEHAPSNGLFLHHDIGVGPRITGQAYAHAMPVEENCNYLLMMQAYAHWTGDLEPVSRNVETVIKLTNYLLWTDRDQSGFPSEGVANTIDDANAAVQFARKQTYLAIKRLAALAAAADLLGRVGHADLARHCDQVAHDDAFRIDDAAWLGDHYAVCVDDSASGIRDVWTDKPLPFDKIPGAQSYSIYTGNGLLLPLMAGQHLHFDRARLATDMANAARETACPYGCGHTDLEKDNVWISQNLWRDHLARYLGSAGPISAQAYWDLQIMSNTGQQSLGFVDTYIGNNLSYYPRGITAIGYLLSGPRLVIDRLAPGGSRIRVDPDRHYAQRWPLLPLADWKAGKIPVCVVDGRSGHRVFIENDVESVIIKGQHDDAAGLIG